MIIATTLGGKPVANKLDLSTGRHAAITVLDESEAPSSLPAEDVPGEVSGCQLIDYTIPANNRRLLPQIFRS